MLKRTTFNSIGDHKYTISTAGELEHLAQKVNSGTGYENTSFILTQDINLAGRNWSPIGKDLYTLFKGTFDGQGHTISGLTIKRDQNYLGLFGYSKGSIKNITLLSPQIEGEKGPMGALIGRSDGGEITDCYVKGGEIDSKGNDIGGLIGDAKNTTITNCHAENVYVSGIDKIGGLMGNCEGNNSMTNCHAACTVTATDGFCGGLIGYCMSLITASPTITACYAQGDVEGKTNVGGLIGSFATNGYTATITSCYYEGTVTNNDSKTIGFIGDSKISGTINFNACYGAFTGKQKTELTAFTGVTYVDAIGSDQIKDMNKTTSYYNADGTLKSDKNYQQQ